MSNYTTQIRFICESKSGLTESVGFNGIMEAIENSVDEIFSFNWPIFDEAYRVPLEIKILRHFYTREISEETFGLWQLRLCDRLNVIMPYYNQLYKSELIKFNPMYDVDLTTEHARVNDGNIDRSEHADFSRSDLTERDNKKNATDDSINDTDSVGTLNSETASTNSNTLNTGEESSVNSSNVSSDSENSVSKSKNWGSNVTSGTTNNEGTRSNKNVNRFSDTPQGNVNIGGGPNDGNSSVDSAFGNGYLTNVTIVDDETKTNDKGKSESLSDETNEGLVDQKIDKNSSNDGIVNQNLKRDETSSGTGNVERNDTKRDKVNQYTSNVHDSNESEKIVGNGSHTNDVTGKVKNMSTEDFFQKISGKRGGLTYSKMLDEFRKTFLNIDRMILNDLESLFIGLWE